MSEQFLNDCLNKADARIERVAVECKRWRQLLVDVVGEGVAETKYRETFGAREQG